MTELTQWQRLLLDLISPRRSVDPARISTLGAEDWNRLLAMARQHRLGPLLHWQLTRGRAGLPVPVGVKDALAAGFKRATLRALEMRRELVLIHRLLTVAGIPYLALKGAFLAFHAYPQPGLRPLRDLDILVPAAAALRAFEVLIAGGLVRPPQYQGNAQAVLGIQRHLPPLQTASGQVTVEVHAHLVNPDEGVVRHVDPSVDPAFWQRAIAVQVAGEALRFPAPTDLLLHLIIHAVLDHKLTNGPLILSDLAFLLERQPIDWPSFWQAAGQGPIRRACWLILRLVEVEWGSENIGWPEPSLAFTGADQSLDQAALLMLRDLGVKDDVRLVHALGRADSGRARLRVLLGRLFPPRAMIAAAYPVRQDSAAVYLYYLPHLWRLASQRLPSVLRSQRQSHVRTELDQLNDLERWLAG